MFPFSGSGLHRYTRRQMRRDRDAAREECQYLRACLRQTASQLGTSVVGEEQVQDQLDQALSANAAYANRVSAEIGTRDTSDPRDRATEPVDVRAWREAHAADYLNETRQAWQPVPESPLADPKPVGPAVLQVDLGDPTVETRFPATARISAPTEPTARQVLDALSDPVRLLSEYLAEAGPTVTVGGDRSTA